LCAVRGVSVHPHAHHHPHPHWHPTSRTPRAIPAVLYDLGSPRAIKRCGQTPLPFCAFAHARLPFGYWFLHIRGFSHARSVPVRTCYATFPFAFSSYRFALHARSRCPFFCPLDLRVLSHWFTLRFFFTLHAQLHCAAVYVGGRCMRRSIDYRYTTTAQFLDCWHWTLPLLILVLILCAFLHTNTSRFCLVCSCSVNCCCARCPLLPHTYRFTVLRLRTCTLRFAERHLTRARFVVVRLPVPVRSFCTHNVYVVPVFTTAFHRCVTRVALRFVPFVVAVTHVLLLQSCDPFMGV